MKKFLPILLLFGFSSPAMADLTHKLSSSVQLSVNAAATQDTAGAAFSFSSSYIQADAVPTSAPTVGQVGNFSSQVSTAAGTKDTLAGTITSAGVITVTAGGAGTVATGQFVNELTIN